MPGIRSNHIIAIITGLILGGLAYYILAVFFVLFLIETKSELHFIALLIINLGICCFVTGYVTLSITHGKEQGMKIAIAIVCALAPWAMYFFTDSFQSMLLPDFLKRGWYILILQSLGCFAGGWLGAAKVIYRNRKQQTN